MLRSRCFSPRLALVMLAAFGLAAVNSPVLAQLGGRGGFGGGQPTSSLVKLKEPVASRVYQRDVNGRAEIPIVLDESNPKAKLIGASIQSQNGSAQKIKLV